MVNFYYVTLLLLPITVFILPGHGHPKESTVNIGFVKVEIILKATYYFILGFNHNLSLTPTKNTYYIIRSLGLIFLSLHASFW